MGEAALEIVELGLAEECFIHCRDYHTIKIISKIKKIQNLQVQRAHIAAHFGRHDEAEELFRYLPITSRSLHVKFRAEDRTDLATEHKKILGDEVKVLGLIKTTQSSGLANDDELRTAYRNVGLKAFSEKRWQDSLIYLFEAGEMDKNIRAHFMANNYQDMSIIGMFNFFASF